jgi:hypothetical protein
MQRFLWLSTTLVVALSTQAAPAHAQVYYGYGPFASGWGGYGYGGGWSSTVQGDVARGLGELAIGAGTYNELTAEANSIDANTVIRWNQYVAGVNQTAVRSYFGRYRTRRDQIVAAREKTSERLRNNPDPRDITSGDALNLALDDLNNARTSLHNLKRAKVRLDGSLIRDIPLQCPGEAITFNAKDLLEGRPPATLAGDGFAAASKALTELSEKLFGEQANPGEPSPESIAGGVDLLQAAWDKVEHTLPAGSAARRDVEAHIKGLSVLCRLLATPAAKVFLAGSDGRPETNLGELVDAMNLGDLRFGVARTARQRALYNTLFPLLAAVRDEGRSPVTASKPTPGNVRPTKAEKANLSARPAKNQVVFNARAGRPQ